MSRASAYLNTKELDGVIASYSFTHFLPSYSHLHLLTVTHVMSCYIPLGPALAFATLREIPETVYQYCQSQQGGPRVHQSAKGTAPKLCPKIGESDEKKLSQRNDKHDYASLTYSSFISLSCFLLLSSPSSATYPIVGYCPSLEQVTRRHILIKTDSLHRAVSEVVRELSHKGAFASTLITNLCNQKNSGE